MENKIRYRTNPLEDLEQELLNLHSVMCCSFVDWLNIHTHFYKPVHAKLWYDKSKYYGDKGVKTEELFKLFLEQHCT